MRKIFILSLLFPFCINAQESVYTLKQCLEIGLQQNYEIQIIKNKQQIAENNASPGNAGYLPALDLGAGYSGTLEDITQHDVVTDQTLNSNGVHNQRLNAGLNLSWTIFDGFSIQANHSRLRRMEELGEFNTRLAIEAFLSNFTAEYYNYIRQSIRLKNLQYIVGLSEERLRIVDASYSIGSMSRLDLQQARVDLNSDKSMLTKQYEILHLLQTQLNEMMGVNDVEASLFLSDSVIEFNSLLERENLYTEMLNNNILLKISKQGETLAQLDLKTYRSQNYPYLKLNAGYGYTKNLYGVGTYDRQENLGLNYGLTLGYTLFDGFNRKRKQQNAKLELKNKMLEYEQAEQALKVDFSNAWMAYQNNLKLIDLEKNNVSTARDNYEIAIERYKLGQLSGIELREAQNSLFSAEERLVQTEYDTKLCEISLMLIGGRIVAYLE